MGKIIDRFFVSADRLEHPDYWIHALAENNLPRYFPEPALTFLDRAIADDARLSSGELGTCLTMMLKANPDLECDPRYARLRNIAHPARCFDFDRKASSALRAPGLNVTPCGA